MCVWTFSKEVKLVPPDDWSRIWIALVSQYFAGGQPREHSHGWYEERTLSSRTCRFPRLVLKPLIKLLPSVVAQHFNYQRPLLTSVLLWLSPSIKNFVWFLLVIFGKRKYGITAPTWPLLPSIVLIKCVTCGGCPTRCHRPGLRIPWNGFAAFDSMFWQLKWGLLT